MKRMWSYQWDSWCIEVDLNTTSVSALIQECCAASATARKGDIDCFLAQVFPEETPNFYSEEELVSLHKHIQDFGYDI